MPFGSEPPCLDKTNTTHRKSTQAQDDKHCRYEWGEKQAGDETERKVSKHGHRHAISEHPHATSPQLTGIERQHLPETEGDLRIVGDSRYPL
ncbi:hypothetical protein ECTPHS_11752 [Ectothiorhodospira sp. PHS-1]|nr:hypothetical protein ECTPHS_11752 [Ectothiorhodospira sp. PHS-1]